MCGQGPQTQGAHLSIDSRYNEGYIATLERAVRGGRPFRYRFGRSVSEGAVGCIERCVRIYGACRDLPLSRTTPALVSHSPTYTASKLRAI